MKGKSVLVAMSGGIDSLAVCLMLQEQGYEVRGVTMRVWDLPHQFAHTDGDVPDFVLRAQVEARRLGISHCVADERDGFRRTVVRYFIDEYLAGRTPNPCVVCNRRFKFRMLTEWADRLGCDRVATGHYVRVKREGTHYYIYKGADIGKDQSYFLWQVGQDVLARCIFPLGNMRKVDVRCYLAAKGFGEMAGAGESMEVCFVENDYRDFLRAQVPDIDVHPGPGLFVDSAGRVLGSHRGVAFYTVGQRKGLGIALGKPAYVLRLNADKNTVVLGNAKDLEADYMLVSGARFVDESLLSSETLQVCIRHRGKPLACSVKRVGGTVEEQGREVRWLVHFKEKASAVTPGQSAVFYCGEQMVGGAFICSQHGLQTYIENVMEMSTGSDLNGN